MLTVAKAAEELGVTPQRVRAMIAAEEFRATKDGRDWDIDRRSFNRYKAKERKPGRPAKR